MWKPPVLTNLQSLLAPCCVALRNLTIDNSEPCDLVKSPYNENLNYVLKQQPSLFVVLLGLMVLRALKLLMRLRAELYWVR